MNQQTYEHTMWTFQCINQGARLRNNKRIMLLKNHKSAQDAVKPAYGTTNVQLIEYKLAKHSVQVVSVHLNSQVDQIYQPKQGTPLQLQRIGLCAH